VPSERAIRRWPVLQADAGASPRRSSRSRLRSAIGQGRWHGADRGGEGEGRGQASWGEFRSQTSPFHERVPRRGGAGAIRPERLRGESRVTHHRNRCAAPNWRGARGAQRTFKTPLCLSPLLVPSLPSLRLREKEPRRRRSKRGSAERSGRDRRGALPTCAGLRR
jgi:hypothetical protein